jgi:EAL and modified HD-GYP domain-containing signal transduction protein
MPDDASAQAFIGRQPILDRQQQLFAYELLFRDGSAGDPDAAQPERGARVVDGDLATATVISNAFSELSLADALGPYQGFIKVDAGLLCSDLINALPPRSVVLEIVENVVATPQIVARCAQLRAAGFTFALRRREPSSQAAGELLELASVIKVDASRFGAPHLKQIVDELARQDKMLLAEKVESHAQMQCCHELGFDLFQGYYFARPTLMRGKHLQPSELALLRLLGLLGQDASDEAVEVVFRQAPLLTVNLLRLINSAASGMSTRVTSLRHAITLLGRRQLLRWLQLLLYSSVAQTSAGVNPLLQLAATRGRLMELMVAHLDGAEGDALRSRDGVDQAYMVGILSLMPTLFACSMTDLLAQLPVAAPVETALCEHAGPLGALLALVEALETFDGLGTPGELSAGAEPAPLAIMRRLPGIDAAIANACLAAALGWANNLARETL